MVIHVPYVDHTYTIGYTILNATRFSYTIILTIGYYIKRTDDIQMYYYSHENVTFYYVLTDVLLCRSIDVLTKRRLERKSSDLLRSDLSLISLLQV